jgi:hypothetical protein
MGGRLMRGLAYLALAFMVFSTGCQAAFAGLPG